MDRYKILTESVLGRIKSGHAQIYCDMDDVLVDFVGGIRDKFGVHDLAADKSWKTAIPTVPNYWEDIPPRPDARQLMQFINKFDCLILTAFASWDLRSIPAKRTWMMKNFNFPGNRVLTVERHQKKNYAKKDGKPAILIDDYSKNIVEWEAAGGIVVLHVSANQTIDKLKTLGFS